MKKIVLWIVSMLSLTVGVAMSGNASARSDSAGKDAVVPDMSDPAVAALLDSINQLDEARPDSSLAVVGWFSKGDTVEYLMGQAKWRINGSDTILAASALRKVRINVLDSTFENTSTTTVSLDPDQQFYHIMTEETSVIPQSFMKQFMGGFVEMKGYDSTREIFENEFDSQVDTSCVIRNILRMD